MKLSRTSWPRGIAYRIFQLSFRQVATSYETYHPISLRGKTLQQGQRACIDRWQMIARLMQATTARSVLDLGCAEGYFVRRAAQDFNCFALGVDDDFKRLLVAQNCALADGVRGAAFSFNRIDLAFLQSIPAFDLVIFLSVMHHIMYEHGVDYARNILKAIRDRTRLCLVFDMGQSNETRNPWASLLPDMGHDPAAWIAEFLRSAGFASVEKIGETDSFQNDAPRNVFSAKP